MRLIEVPRDDIDAARKYYQEHKPLSPDAVRTLLMLQDDPDELREVMRREEWEVRSRG